jgi:hypothetical protein
MESQEIIWAKVKEFLLECKKNKHYLNATHFKYLILDVNTIDEDVLKICLIEFINYSIVLFKRIINLDQNIISHYISIACMYAKKEIISEISKILYNERLFYYIIDILKLLIKYNKHEEIISMSESLCEIKWFVPISFAEKYCKVVVMSLNINTIVEIFKYYLYNNEFFKAKCIINKVIDLRMILCFKRILCSMFCYVKEIFPNMFDVIDDISELISLNLNNDKILSIEQLIKYLIDEKKNIQLEFLFICFIAIPRYFTNILMRSRKEKNSELSLFIKGFF